MEETTAVMETPRAASPYSRKNPFLAELTGHDRLTKAGSLKDTRHFVVNLAASGLRYTPGDSLGAFGRNSPELVDEVIALLGFEPEAAVNDPRGQPTTLRQALLRDYTINRANRKMMAALGERIDRKSTRLNSSHANISYAVFCLKQTKQHK